MKRIMIITQIFLFVLVVYGIYRSNIQMNSLNILAVKYTNIENERNDYKDIIAHFYGHENQLEKNYVGLNEKGEKVSLSQLAKEFKNLRIFKYKISDCSDCINKALEKIQLLNDKSNFLIISDFNNSAKMRRMKKKYGQILFLQVEMFDDFGITPCLYQIDADLKMSNYLYISISDRILPFYLQEINRKDTL